VYEDGTEEVTFQFLLSDREVRRVEKDLSRLVSSMASTMESGRKDRMNRLVEGAEEQTFGAGLGPDALGRGGAGPAEAGEQAAGLGWGCRKDGREVEKGDKRKEGGESASAWAVQAKTNAV
jgi:hypothetical protein